MIRKLLLLAVFVSSLAHTEDIRLQPVKDLKGYFPFKPPSSLAVCGMPYCKGCQQYIKKHRTGHIHSPERWSVVKKLGKKQRLPAPQAAVQALRRARMRSRYLLPKRRVLKLRPPLNERNLLLPEKNTGKSLYGDIPVRTTK
jgi:hypothetical protein